MKVLSVCLLAFFALAVSATFEGTWTDDAYGANFNYCCIRSSKLYCTYAELGIVDGTISGNTVSGKWYEGGGNVVPCSYGTFTWTLSQDGNSFSGSYQCHDSGSGSWDATRVSTEVPTAEQCGARTNSRDISGSTIDGSFVLCNGGGEYQQSYFEDETRPGYEEGVTFDSGSIGTGYYYGHNLELDEYNFGVSLQFVLENGAAVNLYRRGAVFEERPAPFTLSSEVDEFHGAVYDDTWVVENPSSSDCLENKAIKKEVEDFFTVSSGSSGTSGSSSSGSSSSGSSGSSGSSASGSSSAASTLAVGGVMVFLGAMAALF